MSVVPRVSTVNWPNLSQRLRYRHFHVNAIYFSGHNRWSKIKHDKGKEDIAKGKVRSVVSKDLAVASKAGGPDPSLNAQLSYAINNAKKAGLSKASIEAAIAKGQNKSSTGAALEPVIIEAMLPHNVGAIIECLTDNKARALQDIRLTIGRNGGSMAPTGFLFQRKGRNVFRRHERLSVDDILENAIDAGAIDVDTDEEGRLIVDTDPTALTAVAKGLTKNFSLQLENSHMTYDPLEETSVKLENREFKEISDILQLVEEDPAVQDVYTNAILDQR